MAIICELQGSLCVNVDAWPYTGSLFESRLDRIRSLWRSIKQATPKEN